MQFRVFVFIASALCTPVAAQAPRLEAIEQLIAPYVGKDQPGGVVAVTRAGETAHLQSFGEERISAESRPISAETRFYIASVAKMFTAACVHLLAQDGSLSLDDALATHVPELADATPGVTLRHLLHHRSGIRDFYEMGVLLGWSMHTPPPRDQVVELLARQRGSSFAPGRDGGYSNSNYLLLALVVERVSEMPFAEFAEKRLFGPLGMINTGFGIPGEDDVRPSATGHTLDGSRFSVSPVRNKLVGAGGAWSTASDLVSFAQVFTDKRWQSLRAALTAAANLQSDEWLHPLLGDYRAGTMYREIDGMPVHFHPGGYLGSQAIFLHAPSLELTVVVIANRSDLRCTELAFAAAATLGLSEAVSEKAPSAIELPPSGSRLLRARGGDALAMLATRGAVGRFQGLGFDLRLAPIDKHMLRVDGARFPMEIVLAESGIVVELHAPDKAVRYFDLVKSEQVGPGDLAKCAGTYVCEELGGEIELLNGPEGLLLRDTGFTVPIAPFRALSRDVYVSPGRVMVLIEFKRDADGSVEGLILGTGRAQGLHFHRHP